MTECADGGTALDHCTEGEKTDFRSCMCRSKATRLQTSLFSALTLPNETDMYTLVFLSLSSLSRSPSFICVWGGGE